MTSGEDEIQSQRSLPEGELLVAGVQVQALSGSDEANVHHGCITYCRQRTG